MNDGKVVTPDGEPVFVYDYIMFAALTTRECDLDRAEYRRYWPAVVEAHLNAHPDNMALITGGSDGQFGTIKYGPGLYIVRGAAWERDNFYWGWLPMEDPNDANGGDLTAAEALRDATAHYYE